jgi:hypothetical protein
LWLNSGNSGTLLTVLCSPKPTKKTARAQQSEFSAIKSDDDDDNFLYDQSSVYHLNPADESDDSLSDSSYHDKYKHENLSSDLLCQDEETDSASEREGGSDKETDSTSEREGRSDKETDSVSEREGGSDEETDSMSESEDGSDIGTSGSTDANPGPVIPPNDETAFSSTPQFPKDKADLVKLKLVNLVLEIGALLHLFHKIAQWAARANYCGHIFKPDDSPYYKTSLKDLTKRLKLDSLSHTMEDVHVPWSGRVKFPVFEFWAMFQSLIDDPRLHKELLINWNNPSSIPLYDKDYLDEIHSAEWYHDTYKLYNIQDGMLVVLCGLKFFSWTVLMLPEMTARVSSVYFSLFQSSLRSSGTDHGHGAPLGSCLNLRQMIPKDRMPLHHVTVSFLSYYKGCKRPTHLEVSSQMCWDLMAFNKP